MSSLIAYTLVAIGIAILAVALLVLSGARAVMPTASFGAGLILVGLLLLGLQPRTPRP